MNTSISTTAKRLIQLMQHNGLTQKEFAKRVGVSHQRISHSVQNNGELKTDFLRLLCKEFPETNLQWLICGKGKVDGVDEDLEARLKTTDELADLRAELIEMLKKDNSKLVEELREVNSKLEKFVKEKGV